MEGEKGREGKEVREGEGERGGRERQSDGRERKRTQSSQI